MSEIINRILKDIKLIDRFKNSLMMRDKDNWVDGEYKGDIKDIEKEACYFYEMVKLRLKHLRPDINFDNL